MGVRLVSALLVALEGLGDITVPAALHEVDGGQGLERASILGDAVGDGLGVEEEGIPGDVVDVVAGLVVVDVVRDAGSATNGGSLLLGLDALGTGEDTARGDAVLDEGGVVRAAAELGGNGGDLGLLEELLKVLLDHVGALGAGEVEGAAITVVDAVDVVGGGNLFFDR